MFDTNKLKARAGAVLDTYLELVKKNALLEPLLFDKEVIEQIGPWPFGHALNSLKHALWRSCAQDVVKISVDADSKSASLSNIRETLKTPAIVRQLRDEFSQREISPADEGMDPLIIECLIRIHEREELKYANQFDSLLSEFNAEIDSLATDPIIKSFKTLRDKCTAHIEVSKHLEAYRAVDIGDLGLKWGDLQTTITKLRRPVALSGLVTRAADFAWDHFDNQISSNIGSMWRGLVRAG